MSQAVTERGPVARPIRRVRHEVRDSITVMAFSATASCGLAALLALAARVGS